MDNTWWVDPKQLDDDQKKVISAPLASSHLVLGPPGSGKSNLLLLRADFIQRAGHPNSIILVFTKQLQEFICAGSKNYSFPPSKIKRSRLWVMELLKEYDSFPDLKEGFIESRRQLCDALSSLISEKGLSKIYEFIFLDEAQDYWPEEIASFLVLTKHIFAVGDINQKIYDGADGLSFLKTKVNSVFQLRHHYRNGIKICRLADGIAKQTNDYSPLESTANYNEKLAPSSVNVAKCLTAEEVFEKLLKGLSLQLKAYPGEYIGILTPRNEELNMISNYLKTTELYEQGKIQLREDSTANIDETRPIIVSTMHSAKGLEFRVLHLCFLEYVKNFKKKNRNICFTGVTRGKTALYIYHLGGLPGYFEQSLANLEKPPCLPTVEELFVRKELS
jgi:superfamily I DNA/RNA helicase